MWARPSWVDSTRARRRGPVFSAPAREPVSVDLVLARLFLVFGVLLAISAFARWSTASVPANDIGYPSAYVDGGGVGSTVIAVAGGIAALMGVVSTSLRRAMDYLSALFVALVCVSASLAVTVSRIDRAHAAIELFMQNDGLTGTPQVAAGMAAVLCILLSVLLVGVAVVGLARSRERARQVAGVPVSPATSPVPGTLGDDRTES
jgi:hypothetical protein